MADLKNLMTPYKIGNLTIKNRYCMAPMGGNEHFDYHGAYKDSSVEYYAMRARGGFGLLFGGVITPDLEVDPMNPFDGQGGSPLYDSQNWRRQACRLTERVHAYGGKFIQQLTLGYGRNYPTLYSCSENECYAYPMFKSPVLTTDQIRKKVEQVVKAAVVCQSSDIDGIELHALHWGYLLDQFALALVNHREDEYGGTLENRLRVVNEMLDGIKQACGADYPVTVRLGLKSYLKGLNNPSFDGSDEAGRTLEEGIRIAKLLEEYGADALSVDVGTYDSFFHACPPCYVKQGHALDLYAEAKKAVNIPILAGSRMNDPYLCAEALEAGKADAFVLGRPSLADPDLPRKVAAGKPEKIRPCIGCNQGCIARLLEKDLQQTCAVNPRALREIYTPMFKTISSKHVVVVGGGVAGMEAARTASMVGHQVVLFEKSDKLGGDLMSAGAHSFKHEILQLNEWYKGELKDLAVDVHLNAEATKEIISAEKPDVVILAVGAAPIMPKSIPGIDHPKAVTGSEALLGSKPVGERVVIIGGGNVGLEIAVDYAMKGKKVTVVEALDAIMAGKEIVPQQHKGYMFNAIQYYGIEVLTSTKLMAINDDGAEVAPTAGGDSWTIKADTVVCSLGFRPRPSMAAELNGIGAEIFEVGNGKKPGNIISAIGDAFEIARNL